MKIVLNIAALLMMLTFSSCQKDVKDEVSNSGSSINSSARTTGGKTVTYTPVYLSITVASEAPYEITSDAPIPYEHGVNSVRAEFDTYGNLIFSTGSTRFLKFNFSSKYEHTSNTSTETPDAATSKGGGFNTIKSSLANVEFKPLQELRKNESVCVTMAGGITDSDDGSKYVVNFHRQAEDNTTSPTAFVKVTRTQENGHVDGDEIDEWVMEPVCTYYSAVTNVGALRKETKRGVILLSYYNLPFKFVLRRKI